MKKQKVDPILNFDQYIKKSCFPQTPPILFHYSSVEGLYGILTSQSLWATSIHYLNDSSEFKLSVELVEKILAKNVFEAPKIFLEKLRESLFRVQDINIFVASFSEKGDQLSQWRGYCPNGGYAIGFSGNDLRELALEQDFKLLPCVYDSTDQCILLYEIIRDHIYCYETQKETTPLEQREKLLNEIGKSFSQHLVYFAPLIKNTSFKEESEWRIVSKPKAINSADVNFRTRNSLLVPYCKFNLTRDTQKLKLDTIRVGPMPHDDLAMQSIVDFVIRHDIEFQGVTKSKIPYRHL